MINVIDYNNTFIFLFLISIEMYTTLQLKAPEPQINLFEWIHSEFVYLELFFFLLVGKISSWDKGHP